jgi:uncharacterized membrane protein YgdD (TMEM256/DUF423 family)
MKKKMLLLGAIFGISAIILGAFGAHALKKILSTEQLITFETGVRYQMYHALFLLFVGTISGLSQKVEKIIYYLTLFGIILFSGSIYLLATNPAVFRVIGILTPIGGVLLILAWSVFLLAVLKKKS